MSSGEKEKLSLRLIEVMLSLDPSQFWYMQGCALRFMDSYNGLGWKVESGGGSLEVLSDLASITMLW